MIFRILMRSLVGRVRSEASCKGFRQFIEMMDIEEASFQGSN